MYRPAQHVIVDNGTNGTSFLLLMSSSAEERQTVGIFRQRVRQLRFVSQSCGLAWLS